MTDRFRSFGLVIAATLPLCLSATQGRAQSFSVDPGETVGQQVMTGAADAGVIKRQGTIATTNNLEAGVEMLGDNQSLTVESGGTIVTSGNESDGIFSDAENASIVIDGSVITTGNQLAGILSLGPGAEIRNTGTISSQGLEAGYGIAVYWRRCDDPQCGADRGWLWNGGRLCAHRHGGERQRKHGQQHGCHPHSG